MRSVNIKLAASAVVLVLVVAAVPFIGTTEAEADAREGVVLDFGYWNMEWTDMQLTSGMTGDGVLDSVCGSKGYNVIRMSDGSVYSVNGQENLIGAEWGFYVMDGGSWEPFDPELDIGDCSLVSWARANDENGLVPGTDCSGFGYYSYGMDGKSLKTGKDLRVVSLAPSITETIAAVGGLENIVGTDLYSNYPEEVVAGQKDGSITVIGGYTDPNYEWIVGLDPDIVFCDGGTGQHVAIADKLKKSGIDCVVLYDAIDMGVLYDNLWITASALGMSQNANAEIQNINKTVNAVSGIAGDSNRRVFASLSADPSPWTAGSHTYMSDIISNSGGRNVFDSQASSWFMVSKEQIYAKQPHVILIIGSTHVTDDDSYQELLDSLDPLWKATPAFRNGDVYVFSGDAEDVMSRPGPRLSEATELVCKILNPQAFTDRDPMDVLPKYFGDDYRQYLTYQQEGF